MGSRNRRGIETSSLSIAIASEFLADKDARDAEDFVSESGGSEGGIGLDEFGQSQG